MPSRVSAIYWGGNFQNTLFLGYPLKSVITDREPRAGTSFAQAPSGIEDSWIAYDYTLECEGQFLPAFPNAFGSQASFAQQTALSGPTGIQAFLDFARAKGSFRFVPDVTLPKFWIDGCYLKEPVSGGRSLSPQFDWNQKFVFRNPTMDFWLALRGLFLEYAPGASLSDPVAYTVARAQAAYRIAQNGTLVLDGGNILRDRHYVSSTRTTLFETSSTNYALRSETFDDATWTKAQATIAADAVAAPSGALTADKLAETAVTNNHYVYQTGIPITSGEKVAGSVFVKNAGRFRGRLYVGDIAGTNFFATEFNLTAGTTSAVILAGAATAFYSRIVPLASGWYRIEVAGAVNGGVTSGHIQVNIYDDSGNVSYLGDITKGLYLWGGQLERWNTGVNGPCTSYMATTSGTASRNSDVMSMVSNWPWPTQPLWIYAKFIDLGWSQLASFGELVKWTNAAANQPMLRMFTGAGVSGQTPNHRFNYSNGLPGVAGGNQASAIVTPGANVGDTVELFARVFSDGSTEIQRSINAGAVVTANSGGGPGGFPDFFDIASYSALGVVFYVSVAAMIGLIRLKIGPGTSQITTLAQGAAA